MAYEKLRKERPSTIVGEKIGTAAAAGTDTSVNTLWNAVKGFSKRITDRPREWVSDSASSLYDAANKAAPKVIDNTRNMASWFSGKAAPHINEASTRAAPYVDQVRSAAATVAEEAGKVGDTALNLGGQAVDKIKETSPSLDEIKRGSSKNVRRAKVYFKGYGKFLTDMLSRGVGNTPGMAKELIDSGGDLLKQIIDNGVNVPDSITKSKDRLSAFKSLPYDKQINIITKNLNIGVDSIVEKIGSGANYAAPHISNAKNVSGGFISDLVDKGLKQGSSLADVITNAYTQANAGGFPPNAYTQANTGGFPPNTGGVPPGGVPPGGVPPGGVPPGGVPPGGVPPNTGGVPPNTGPVPPTVSVDTASAKASLKADIAAYKAYKAAQEKRFSSAPKAKPKQTSRAGKFGYTPPPGGIRGLFSAVGDGIGSARYALNNSGLARGVGYPLLFSGIDQGGKHMTGLHDQTGNRSELVRNAGFDPTKIDPVLLQNPTGNDLLKQATTTDDFIRLTPSVGDEDVDNPPLGSPTLGGLAYAVRNTAGTVGDWIWDTTPFMDAYRSYGNRLADHISGVPTPRDALDEMGVALTAPTPLPGRGTPPSTPEPTTTTRTLPTPEQRARVAGRLAQNSGVNPSVASAQPVNSLQDASPLEFHGGATQADLENERHDTYGTYRLPQEFHDQGVRLTVGKDGEPSFYNLRRGGSRPTNLSQHGGINRGKTFNNQLSKADAKIFSEVASDIAGAKDAPQAREAVAKMRINSDFLQQSINPGGVFFETMRRTMAEASKGDTWLDGTEMKTQTKNFLDNPNEKTLREYREYLINNNAHIDDSGELVVEDGVVLDFDRDLKDMAVGYKEFLRRFLAVIVNNNGTYGLEKI